MYIDIVVLADVYRSEIDVKILGSNHGFLYWSKIKVRGKELWMHVWNDFYSTSIIGIF